VNETTSQRLFMFILVSLTKLHLSPKHVTVTFVNFAVSGLTSIRQLPVRCTIVTSIVHSKLDCCNSLYHKLPKSQLSCLQQIQYFLARTVLKTPKSCHITPILYALSTGSGSLNASNKSSSHLPTKFSQLPNLHSIPS